MAFRLTPSLLELDEIGLFLLASKEASLTKSFLSSSHMPLVRRMAKSAETGQSYLMKPNQLPIALLLFSGMKTSLTTPNLLNIIFNHGWLVSSGRLSTKRVIRGFPESIKPPCLKWFWMTGIEPFISSLFIDTRRHWEDLGLYNKQEPTTLREIERCTAADEAKVAKDYSQTPRVQWRKLTSLEIQPPWLFQATQSRMIAKEGRRKPNETETTPKEKIQNLAGMEANPTVFVDQRNAGI